MTTPERDVTVALVHGAFADSTSWTGVISALQAAGISAVAVSNPLRGLAEDGMYVASKVEQIDGDVILVGHSYGGAVITHAGARAGNVRALVYVAAFAPDAGEVIGALIAAHPPTLLGSSLHPGTYPTAAGPAPELFIEQSSFHEVFAADLSASRVAPMSVSQRPIAAQAFAEPLEGEPAWRRLPSWFVVASADNAIHPESQRADAARMGATVVEIAASHAVAVSAPVEVAAAIIDAVTAILAREEVVAS